MYRIARDWRGRQTYAVVEQSERFPDSLDGLNTRQAVPDDEATVFATASDAAQAIALASLRRADRFGIEDAWNATNDLPFYIVNADGTRI